MFSGIKSILFGYTESEAKKDDTNEFALPNESSFSHDTSVLLEQTLNSATTKFTEQLLPQSPSIEQLQSSSHQLLPTLIEQHEEDEKKKKEIEPEVGNKVEDDDDDCFNADSWELLDLVEKQEADSLNSTVQEELVIVKAGGILKQKNRSISPNKCKDSLRTQRQKQKVSFETSNLVKDRQKIEPIVAKEKIKSNSKSSKKNKKKSRIEGIASSNEIVGVEVEKPSLAVQQEKFEVKDQVVVKSAPVLNYAAALTKNQNIEKVDISIKTSVVTADSTGNNLIASLPTKRNRPVSTSSWSSNDEVEAVASNWSNIDKELGITQKGLKENVNVAIEDILDDFGTDDKDSIISSGFSDCDYGYGGLNDYIMRPKKSQNKKRRGLSSIYCSINNSVPKRGHEQVAAPRKTSLTGGSQERQELSRGSALTSSKHIKPRKKKMVLSIPSNSSEFLKKRTVINCGKAPASASSLVEPIAASSISTASSYLMPPPSQLQNIASSSTSGNDSSDIADMDESWYVTPPPCFTGTNKLDRTSKPKAKEADRENALIEHPSIYIASTSTNKDSKKNSPSKQMSIVLKKINHKQSVVNNPAKSEQKRKCIVSAAQQARPEKKRDVKAWENKFIVTNWAYDEQDDLKGDFFDNLFEVEEQVVNPPKPKVSKTKKQVGSQAVRSESPCLLEISADYESDFSNTPALIGTTDNLTGDELLQVSSDDMILISPDENTRPVVASEVSAKRRNKSMGERRAPLQVAPIEPERQPGWQLRRKRSRRRPLTVSMANTCSAAGGIKNPVGKMLISQEVGQQQISVESSSNNSSARSTPSLIDRIGSSIVANLTNLTNGFPNGAIPIQAQRAAIEEVEKLNQVAVRKSNSELNLLARRRMSKAYLDRQNDCARLANSNRRADRRLKMHSTPNGSSVNRKVHASFH